MIQCPRYLPDWKLDKRVKHVYVCVGVALPEVEVKGRFVNLGVDHELRIIPKKSFGMNLLQIGRSTHSVVEYWKVEPRIMRFELKALPIANMKNSAIYKGRLHVPCTCDSSMGIHQKRLEDRDHVHHHDHDYQQPKLQ